MEPEQCLYDRVQRLGPDSAIQGHGEARAVSGTGQIVITPANPPALIRWQEMLSLSGARLVCAIVVVRHRRGVSRWSRPGLGPRCVGMIAMSIWIAVRGSDTVRINSTTLTWDAESPPRDWRASVEHAERFHIAGVWAAMVAFALF